MGIILTGISREKGFSTMNRTKINFWRTDLTIDLIIVVFDLICFAEMTWDGRRKKGWIKKCSG
jgi:hypothetical protein